MAAATSSSGQLASLLRSEAAEDGSSLHLRKTLEQAIPAFSGSPPSPLTPSEEVPPSSYFSFSFTRNFSSNLSNRAVMPLIYSLVRHCRNGGIHFLQSTYSPLLLSESIVKKIETDCRTENNSDEGSAVESSTETANADDLPSDTCQPQPAQDESYDDNFEEEEDEDLRTSDDSEEDETDDEQDYEEEDDEDLIQFSDSEVPSVPAPQPVTYLLQPPGIKHISSFSSEESGFCENTNYPDWSNSEDEEELDDDAVDSCSFDEGLWHMLENQACFMKIPKCSTLKSTKGILNRAEECTTKLFDHEDTDNVSITSRYCVPAL